MTKARTNASTSPAVGRNMIINGAMTVAQRGTSFADANGIYTLDRFRFNTKDEDEFEATVSQSTEAPDGFSTSLRVDVTTAESAIASDERISIEQRIEAQNLQHLNYGTSAARTTTLSMWVNSSRTGKYGVNIRAHDAADSYIASFTINSVDTWEHKTMTIDGNTLANGGITNDNGLGLWFRLMLLSGTDFRTDTVDQWVASTSHYVPTDAQNTWGTAATDNFYLTGVQWEVGPVATEFEQEDIGTTLAKCQRYYQKWLADTANDSILTGSMISDTGFIGDYFLKTSMRAVPTLATTGTFAVRLKTNDRSLSAGPVLNRATPDTVQLSTTIADNNESGFAGFLKCASSDDDAFVEFIAEL